MKKKLFIACLSMISICAIYSMDSQPSESQQKLNTELLLLLGGPSFFDCEAMVRDVLSRGAQITAMNENGHTPFVLAVLFNHRGACRALLDYNANINAISTFNNIQITPLMIAAHRQYPSLCKWLIDNGAHVNGPADANPQVTALSFAARKHNDSICKLLLDNGADISLALQADCDSETYQLLIAYPSFVRRIPKKEFRNSRKRIWTALCVFKRYIPAMPREVRKLILCAIPELKQDFLNSAACNIYSNIISQEIPCVPLEVLQLLIHDNKLDSELVVMALKEHHCTSIKPLMLTAMLVKETDEERAILNPNYLEKNHGKEIELEIKRKLKLIPEPPMLVKDFIHESSCTMQ